MDAAERETIIAVWRAEAAIPVPPDRSRIGCVAALLAIALAGALPPAIRTLGYTLPAGTSGIVLGTFAVIFAWGVFTGITGRSKRFNAVANRAAEALGRLTTHPADRGPEALRAAVTLIQCAFFSSGPTTVTTLDVAAARERLGPALPFVLEVERVLVDASLTYPVFTAP